MFNAVVEMVMFIAIVTLGTLLALLALDTPFETERFLQGFAMLVMASLFVLVLKRAVINRNNN